MSEISDELNQKMGLLLNPRERSVMEMRLGVGHSRSLTLHEIGAELGISRERVRQLQFRALQKLSDPTLNERLLVASITRPEPKKFKTPKSKVLKTKPVRVSVSPTDEMVSIRFNKPVSGTDPFDHTDIISTKHWVSASWAKQDGNETLFLDEEGTVIASWPTSDLESIQWPYGDSVKPTPEAFKNRMDEIKSLYPKAWTKWDEVEDTSLIDEYDSKTSLDEMCSLHERAPGGICSRLKKLGRVPDEFHNWQIMELIQNRHLEQ